MKKLKKEMNRALIVSLIITIMFVVGIPLIPCFAGKNTLLMVVGIVFAAVGFYGTPIAWVHYSSFFGVKRVVEAVLEENLYTNKEIAMQLSISEKNAKQLIVNAINKKYLTGFLYDGEKLTLNQNKKQEKQVEAKQMRCDSCGGRLDKTENGYICPYCGLKYE